MTKNPRRDIVVPCRGRGHKVRLAPGLRFFASARCPRCRAPVDPTRGLRLLRFGANLRRPASRRLRDRALWLLTLAALLLSALTAILFLRLADVWWPATLLLFGPRWILLLPIVILALSANSRDKALLLPLGVAALIMLGPVMGFHTGWRTLLTFGDPERDITVASFNARSGLLLTAGTFELMNEWDADVAAFQECATGLQEELRDMRVIEDWYVWTGESLCLLSKLPIVATRVSEADVIQNAGGSGLIVSHRIQGDGGAFWVTNVHLQTPRDGLELIRLGRIAEGIEVLKRDSFLREIEHRRARSYASAPGPHIVVGDFNTPAESRIYREQWDGWTNAFTVAGLGIGGTRLNGWIRSRIDHVLVSDHWKVVDAWMGADAGSDHRPMVATVRRR